MTFCVHYLLAQGARVSSLYVSFMARDIAWILQSTENGKKKHNWNHVNPEGGGSWCHFHLRRMTHLLFSLKYLPLIFPDHHISEVTISQIKTKLHWVRNSYFLALPFHLPYCFLPLSVPQRISGFRSRNKWPQETEADLTTLYCLEKEF